MDPSVSRVLYRKKGQFCTGNFWFASVHAESDPRQRQYREKCCRWTRAWLNYLQPRLGASASWLIGRCCESKAPLVLFEDERERNRSTTFFRWVSIVMPPVNVMNDFPSKQWKHWDIQFLLLFLLSVGIFPTKSILLPAICYQGG